MARGRPKKANDGTAKGKKTKANGNGANLGFEAQMFLAAGKLRKNLEPSDDKHVALGLIFLRSLSSARRAETAVIRFH
jgi:type I restriction enzyme M protein